jgi:hypothetical protein
MGLVHIPFYATVFRGDQFAEALIEIAPVALRYGADEYRVTRSLDDRYKFLFEVNFEDKLDFDRFWQGPEVAHWRARYHSWYQIPLVYDPTELIAHHVVRDEPNGVAERNAEPAA